MKYTTTHDSQFRFLYSTFNNLLLYPRQSKIKWGRGRCNLFKTDDTTCSFIHGADRSYDIPHPAPISHVYWKVHILYVLFSTPKKYVEATKSQRVAVAAANIDCSFICAFRLRRVPFRCRSAGLFSTFGFHSQLLDVNRRLNYQLKVSTDTSLNSLLFVKMHSFKFHISYQTLTNAYVMSNTSLFQN